MGYVAMLFPFEAERECEIVVNDSLRKQVSIYVIRTVGTDACVVKQNYPGAAGRPRTICKIII